MHLRLKSSNVRAREGGERKGERKKDTTGKEKRQKRKQKTRTKRQGEGSTRRRRKRGRRARGGREVHENEKSIEDASAKVGTPLLV